MPWLALNIAGEYSRREIKRAIIAGSGESDAIRLSGKSALRHHFKLDCDTGGWYIQDLLGTELVTVNNSPMLRRYLTDGDEICLNDDSIVFHTDDPVPFLILNESDGCRPAAPDELPSIGPYLERILIAEAFSYHRSKRAWLKVTLVVVGIALIMGVHAFFTSTPPEDVVEDPQQNAIEYMNSASQLAASGDLATALINANLALHLGLNKQDENLLTKQMESWIEEKSKLDEAAASKISDAYARIKAHPSAAIAHKGLFAEIEVRALRGYAQSFNRINEWQIALDKSAELVARGEHKNAAAILEAFAQSDPASPYAPAALLRADELTRRSSMVADFYARIRPPRLLAFDFATPRALLDWRVESGEWQRSTAGITVVSVAQNPAMILCEKAEYSASSLWLRLCCARPKQGSLGTLSAGISNEDGSGLRIEVTATKATISMVKGDFSMSKSLDLPKSDIVQIELAIYDGAVLFVCGEDELSFKAEGSRTITGNPVLSATSTGTEFFYFAIGY